MPAIYQTSIQSRLWGLCVAAHGFSMPCCCCLIDRTLVCKGGGLLLLKSQPGGIFMLSEPSSFGYCWCSSAVNGRKGEVLPVQQSCA
jgi:hypothetical protein